jgi:hypothetical protein
MLAEQVEWMQVKVKVSAFGAKQDRGQPQAWVVLLAGLASSLTSQAQPVRRASLRQLERQQGREGARRVRGALQAQLEESDRPV